MYQDLSHYDTAPDMARVLVQSGWHPQFRVFNDLQRASLAAEDDGCAWAHRLPPQSTRRRRRGLAM